MNENHYDYFRSEAARLNGVHHPQRTQPVREIDPIQIQLDELQNLLNAAQDPEEAEHLSQLIKNLKDA